MGREKDIDPRCNVCILYVPPNCLHVTKPVFYGDVSCLLVYVMYRVTHLLARLGWIDFYLGVLPSCLVA